MDTRINRRSLAVFMLTGAMWVFARRPIVVLMAAILCYLNWEHWFGVRPLRLYELLDVLGSKTEATIAAAGLLVAIASITAFRHVKRLDLELAAAASITAIIRDASAVFSRIRLYCDALVAAKDAYLEVVDATGKTAGQSQGDRERLNLAWTMVMKRVEKMREDQEAVWEIARRLIDLNDQHGAIIRTKVLTPWLLERALYHAETLASGMVFPVPNQGESARTFIPSYFLIGAKQVADYIALDEKHRMRLLGFLGGASAIGSSSVAPVSLITAVRSAGQLWRL